MKQKKLKDSVAEFEQRVKKTGKEKYVLRLYVAGVTTKSIQATRNIQQICDEHLKGRYDLEIIDIIEQPVLAKGEQIIATPTLLKKLPLPLQQFVGDMARIDRILVGLDLQLKE